MTAASININIDQIIPTLVVIIGAAIYCFGIFAGERQPGEPSENMHYLNGAIYTVKFIVFPYGVIIFLEYLTSDLSEYKQEIITHFRILFLIVLLFLQCLIYLLVRKKEQKIVSAFKSEDELKKIKYEKTNQVENLFGILYLWGVPFFEIFIVDVFYKLREPFETTLSYALILTFFVLSFFTFINFAAYIGYRESFYHEVVLRLKSGGTIMGTVIKYRNYVKILTDDKVSFINRDAIEEIIVKNEYRIK